MEMKKLCLVHRYMYNGNECPFCKKEEFEKKELTKYKHVKKKKKVKSEEITKESLEKLMNKFNRK